MSNQPTIEFVTTFSQKGYLSYGQAFIDSFIEHVDAPLTIYHESQDLRDDHKLLAWRNLDDSPDRKEFLETHGSDPGKVGSPRDFRSQSIRFCHKVFALSDAVARSEADWVIWVDADVVWHGPFTDSHAERMLEGYDLAFLGRERMPHSECGWVSYRLGSPGVLGLLAAMLDYYTSGRIFTRPKSDWHDSRCFDICREESGIPRDRQHNLSAGLNHGWDAFHPWPSTMLGEFCTHHKGPKRKSEAYGSIVR